MKIEIEISRPHYHPSHDSAETLLLTKKRDLSVPPHYVTNERINHPDTGESYAIVMPPRDHELWEDRQSVHIHCNGHTFLEIKELFGLHHSVPADNEVITVPIQINGFTLPAKVKIHEGYDFEPKIHFDHVDAEHYGINSGDFAEV